MTEAKKYRKKPVVINAMLFTGENAEGVMDWVYSFPDSQDVDVSASRLDTNDDNWTMHIGTLEGTMDCSPGDYIIRGVVGEFYPCKPEKFAETYEEEF